MDLEIALASNNQEKLRVVENIWRGSARIITLQELSLTAPVDLENGTTYQQNAERKAQWLFERTGHHAFADDSGMEISGLAGQPGTQTHRWAASDEELLQRTLTEIKGLPEEKRHCDFIICAVAILKTRVQFEVIERDSGILLLEPRGEMIPGHPLASLLWIPKMEATLAELRDDKTFQSKDVRAHKKIKTFVESSYF